MSALDIRMKSHMEVPRLPTPQDRAALGLFPFGFGQKVLLAQEHKLYCPVLFQIMDRARDRTGYTTTGFKESKTFILVGGTEASN